MTIRSWTRPLTVVTLALVAAAGALLHASEAEQPEELRTSMLASGRRAPVNNMNWQPVMQMSFDDAAEIEDAVVAEGHWEVRDGALHAIAGERNRTILLGKVSGDRLRFAFDATSHANADGTLGDITVLINAEPGKAPTTAGYALTTASYYNTCTTFYREGQKLARTEHSPIESGRTNRVVVELDRGHLRFWINDAIVLEAWDTQPIAADEKLFIGLRTYNTHMVIDNFTLSRGEPAARRAR